MEQKEAKEEAEEAEEKEKKGLKVIKRWKTEQGRTYSCRTYCEENS